MSTGKPRKAVRKMAEQNEYCFMGKDWFWSLIIGELGKEKSMNKQIEEMAKDLAESIVWDNEDILTIDCYRTARMLSDKYRKSTDVAREIFAEIEQEIAAALKSNYKVLPQVIDSYELYHTVQGKISALRGIEGFIAELKKKYESENSDVK